MVVFNFSDKKVSEIQSKTLYPQTHAMLKSVVPDNKLKKNFFVYIVILFRCLFNRLDKVIVFYIE